ncbi:MAG: hypothetical protein NTW28_06085 [Candidatus Solibacter sp.]|nr:hypothetical protein [Candidatus Solibacter sp.]
MQLKVAVLTDDGRANLTQETTQKLILRPAEYRKAVENGVRVAFQLKMPGPGAWQIRAAVVDSASDRIGSATRFVEIPDVKKGGLALSGLILRGGSPGDSAPADPREDAGMRIFKSGQNCTFMYNVFNPLIGQDKQSSLEVQTRILTEGRVVYEGVPGRIAFGEAPEGTRRRITGQIKLDRQVAAGDYILLVMVRDLLAPSGQTRTATQFIDFQVRE